MADDSTRVTRIVQRNDDAGDDDQQSASSRRHGEILVLSGISKANDDDGTNTIMDDKLFYQIGAFLAYKSIKERSGTILEGLPVLLEECTYDDFELHVSFRDNQFGKLSASQQFLEALESKEEDDDLVPFSIVGAEYSSTSTFLNVLTNIYEIPMVSGSATSKTLDKAPLFARTIPTNRGDAVAAMEYYSTLGVTHVACLHEQGTWGRFYNADLRQQAQEFKITMLNIPINGHDKADVEQAMLTLKESNYRTVFAMVLNIQMTPILQYGYEHQIMGPNTNYSWIFAEASDLISPAFQVSKTSPDLALAHHGFGSLDIHFNPHAAIENAYHEFIQDTTLQQEFIALHHQPELFVNYTFVPAYNFKSYLYFDAVIALGLAACNTPRLFTGSEIYQQLLQTEFEGVSEQVRFDNTTGTRNYETVQYRLDNILLSSNRSTPTSYLYDSHLAAVVAANQPVDFLEPFVYANGGTAMPTLPPQEHNYNEVPFWALMIGWVLSGIVIAVSGLAMLWTALNRNVFVVRASQPVFLIQLCVGTTIMACAIVPLSFQGTETSERLDRACMAFPWLVFVGFVIAFAAIFSKTWRANKLINSGRGMRRIRVQPQDVLLPLIIFLPINVALLTAWTLVSPLTYQRVDGNSYDQFGRIQESYGICASDHSLAFSMPIIAVNFCGIVAASYQVYMARNLPTTFSESKCLGLCVGSVLETLCLGGPILIVAWHDPTANYLVCSALISVTCLTFLLPIFLPKYRARNVQEKSARAAPAALLAVATSAHSSRHHGSSNRLGRPSAASSALSRPSKADEYSDQDMIKRANVRGMMTVTRKHTGNDLDISGHSTGSQRSFSGMR